jgi:short subunit fatty acids transporter|tara:strand:+ start:69 stop:245 length:177 start_codon:yes stop_codon:yes gene_type:complete
MNLIELLFIIVCVWVLYIAIKYALEDIRDVELELEEVKKQLKQEKEDVKLRAELLINK